MDLETPAMRRKRLVFVRIDYATNQLGCGWSIQVGQPIAFSEIPVSAVSAELTKEKEVCQSSK